VTDNGVPAMGATNRFRIKVTSPISKASSATLAGSPDPKLSPDLTIRWQAGADLSKQVRFASRVSRLSASSSRNYCLQVSEDLVNWSTLAVVSSTETDQELNDEGASGRSMRFYRIIGEEVALPEADLDSEPATTK
jgi:hypothetical protein